MVCGAISFNGKLDLVWIEGKMDLAYYNKILETALLPISNNVLEEDWIL